MSLSTWLLKTFQKTKIVKAIVFHSNHRITTHYVKPHNGVIKVGTHDYSLTDKDFYLDSESIVTYTYKEGRITPIDPSNWQDVKGMTSDEFQVAIESKALRELMIGGSTPMDAVVMIIGAVVVIGLLYIGYMQMQQQELIKQMWETLKLVGGIE